MTDDASIDVAPNGPYMVKGEIPLVVKTPLGTERGEPIAWATSPALTAARRYALCRCGQSENKPFCDGTHARVDFEADDSRPESYDERAKAYEGPGITVYDDRSICTHAGFCGTAATNVWKMVRRADETDVRSQIAAMVERCPSGALTYTLDGAPGPIEPDLPASIAVVPDGPLFVGGGVPVTIGDEALERRNRVTLCRCGASGSKPLCDGSHKDAGFRHTPDAPTGSAG